MQTYLHRILALVREPDLGNCLYIEIRTNSVECLVSRCAHHPIMLKRLVARMPLDPQHARQTPVKF